MLDFYTDQTILRGAMERYVQQPAAVLSLEGADAPRSQSPRPLHTWLRAADAAPIFGMQMFGLTTAKVRST